MLKDKLIPDIHNVMRKELQSVAMDLLKSEKTFVVWGAGNTGRQTLEYLEGYAQGNLTPEYIVDNNKSLWGMNNIKSPKEFFLEKERIDVVLVCVYVADQVVKQLKENGYKGLIVPVSMSLLHMDEDVLRFYDENMDDIERMYELLADERFKKTVEVFLNVLRSADVSLWDEVNGESVVKLMDPEVFHLSNKEHFVDVGAFTGDTIAKFIELCGGRYQSIIGFEPDQKNYSALKDYVNAQHLESVLVYSIAAGAEDGMRCFISDHSESCVLSERGETMVQIAKLDSIEEVQATTLLKISANGCDLEVLKGAEELIKKNKPQISAYASGTLLWEIPFFLKKLVPDYKIYYRHYGIGRQAMICYAIPNDIAD